MLQVFCCWKTPAPSSLKKRDHELRNQCHASALWSRGGDHIVDSRIRDPRPEKDRAQEHSGNGPCKLRHDVEEGVPRGNLAQAEECDCHGWIKVRPGPFPPW